MGKALDARKFFDRLRQFPDLDVEIAAVDELGVPARIKEVSCDDSTGNIVIYIEKENLNG